MKWFSANWDSTKWLSQFLRNEILRNEFLSFCELIFCELIFCEMNFSVSAYWDSTKWISQFLRTDFLRTDFLRNEMESLKSLKPHDRSIDAINTYKQTSQLCNSLLILYHKFRISFLLNLLKKFVEPVSFMIHSKSFSYHIFKKMHLISFIVCQMLCSDEENKFRWMVTGITGNWGK